jgi:hypothetical protein
MGRRFEKWVPFYLVAVGACGIALLPLDALPAWAWKLLASVGAGLATLGVGSFLWEMGKALIKLVRRAT